MYSYSYIRHILSEMLQTEDEVQKAHVLVDLKKANLVSLLYGDFPVVCHMEIA